MQTINYILGRYVSSTTKRLVNSAFFLWLAMPLCCVSAEPCVSNSSPSISITRPPNGRIYTFLPVVRIACDVSDTDGMISKVELMATNRYIGLSRVATLTNPPFTFRWSVPDVGISSVVLTAIATDDCGASTTSAPVTIYVAQDINLPEVKIQTPISGALYRPGAPVVLSALVWTSDGSEEPVAFYSGDNLIGWASFNLSNPMVGSANTYSMLWTNASSGSHSITARVMDGAGQEGQSTNVSISVENLLLTDPNVNPRREFSFLASGVATGAPLLILGSSKLQHWIPLFTNYPTASPFSINIGPVTNSPYQQFRLWSDR